jgi:hypothetical protein
MAGSSSTISIVRTGTECPDNITHHNCARGASSTAPFFESRKQALHWLPPCVSVVAASTCRTNAYARNVQLLRTYRESPRVLQDGWDNSFQLDSLP